MKKGKVMSGCFEFFLGILYLELGVLGLVCNIIVVFIVVVNNI